MENMDIMDQISELKLTINSLKATATVFARTYTEGTPENNLLAVKTDEEIFSDLFRVITEQIFEAKQQAEALEAALEGSDQK